MNEDCKNNLNNHNTMKIDYNNNLNIIDNCQKKEYNKNENQFNEENLSLHSDIEKQKRIDSQSREYNYTSNLNNFFDIDEFLDKTGYTVYHFKLIFLGSLFFFIDGSEKMVINLMLATIREEWNLNTFKRSLTSSSIFLGFFIGSLISGFISNRYGRVKPIKFCIFSNFIFSIFSAFSPNLITLFILRSLMGLVLGIIIPSVTTLVVESIPNNGRGFIVNFIWVLFPIGIIYICAISMYLLYNQQFLWRKILFINAFTSLIVGFLVLNLKESPRFLLLKGWGRANELIEILNSICASRKSQLSEDEKDYLSFLLDESKHHMIFDKQGKSGFNNSCSVDFENIDKKFHKFYTGNFANHYHQYNKGQKNHEKQEMKDLQILTKKNNMRLNLLLIFIWFSASFISLGLFYILPKIYEKINKQDKHELLKNMIYSVLIILPCPIVRGIIADIKIIGRKWTFIISFVGSSVTALLCIFIIKAFFIYAGFLKFFINISVGIINVYTTEVYPTNVRSIALGFGNGIARLTGFLTPFICESMEYYIFRGTFYGFFLLSILGIFAAYYLPFETLGKRLDFRDEECYDSSSEKEDDKILIESQMNKDEKILLKIQTGKNL